MGKSNNATVAGVDVGYGNVKCVVGCGDGAQRDVVLPAGAAPAEQMPKLINRQPDLKGGELVLIPVEDGVVPWVGGVEQVVLQHSVRQTHAQYTSTKAYHALYLAALAKMRAERIDLLVTGLPVSQYYDPRVGEPLRQGLQKLMTGRHHINDQVTVQVDRTLVIPQPTGTFMGVAAEPQHSYLVTDNSLTTLVVDAGFFSLDYVSLSGRSVRDQSSGSSQLATSHILEKAAERLSVSMDRFVDPDRLDAAFRGGAPMLRLGGEEVDYLTVLRAAAAEVASEVVGEIQRKMRGDKSSADVLILAGGGAELYAPALAKVFPKAKLIRPADPVLSNARGYYTYGQLALGAARAA